MRCSVRASLSCLSSCSDRFSPLMLSWSPVIDTSMSPSLTPGNSAVSVTALSSSAMSTRGANTPPMLRPNQSSNSESIWLLKPRKFSTSRWRSPHPGNHDLLAMAELLLLICETPSNACCAWRAQGGLVNTADAGQCAHALDFPCAPIEAGPSCSQLGCVEPGPRARQRRPVLPPQALLVSTKTAKSLLNVKPTMAVGLDDSCPATGRLPSIAHAASLAWTALLSECRPRRPIAEASSSLTSTGASRSELRRLAEASLGLWVRLRPLPRGIRCGLGQADQATCHAGSPQRERLCPRTGAIRGRGETAGMAVGRSRRQPPQSVAHRQEAYRGHRQSLLRSGSPRRADCEPRGACNVRSTVTG